MTRDRAKIVSVSRGTVFNRGTRERPVWWLQFSVNGRRFREPIAGARTKTEAEAALQARQKILYETAYGIEKPIKENLTLGRLRDLHLESKKNLSSFKSDRSRWVTLIEALGSENTPVASLKPMDIERLKEPGPGRTSPYSINHHIQLIRAAVRWAIRNRLTRGDPTTGVALLKAHARDRHISGDEFDAILKATVERPALHMIASIGFFTGMRMGEIVNLRWSWIDLDNRFILLPPEFTKTNEPRRVPMTSLLVIKLKEYKKRAPEGERLFRGKPESYSSNFSRLKKQLRLDLRFHDARHTALTNMRRAGVDLVTLKKISGHKTWEMMERYQSVSHDELLDAVDKTFGNKPSKGSLTRSGKDSATSRGTRKKRPTRTARKSPE